jgi:hypothetical protein
MKQVPPLAGSRGTAAVRCRRQTPARIELMAGGGMVTSRRIVKVGDPYQVTAIGRRKNGENYCLRNWMKKFLFFCSGYGRNSLGRRDSEGAELSR